MIEVLCYSGVFGLLLFLIFVFNIGRSAYKNFNKEGNVLPLALFFPSMGLILTGQIFDQRIVWIIFAYQIALASKNLNTQRKTSQLSSTSPSIT
jgi:O-antigen ligase